MTDPVDVNVVNWLAFGRHIQKRAETLLPQSGRLFHGRSGGFPGLEKVNVDAFPPVLVLVTYGDLAEEIIQRLVEALRKLSATSGWPDGEGLCVMHQIRMGSRAHWSVPVGQPPETLFAKYLGLEFEVSVGQTQNVGIFPDMAEGHRLVRRLAPGKRILNLFAYTCVFSVLAMQAGAASVVNVDLSKPALARGRRNHLHNRIPTNNVRFLPHHVMKSMSAFRRLGPFDMVICDPPSFQAGSFEAVRDYPKLARRLPECLAPGADVIACLNAPHLDRGDLEQWFDARIYRRLAGYGRPETYGERNPDRDLKILHYRHES